MSIIPNLRTNHGSNPGGFAFGPLSSPPALSQLGEEVRPQAYLDTPKIIYSEWNQAAGGICAPLGSLRGTFRICLIGGGIANVAAALELRKAGADVTLIEARDEVGGRTRSERTPDGVNVAEMGAMRFPPSCALLYYYAQAFGFTFISNFPDPGKVSTIVSFRGETHNWSDPMKIPPGFERVYNGWDEFLKHGVGKAGATVLTSVRKLSTWLQSPTQTDRAKVIPAWKNYLDKFGQDSFYSGLVRIFGSAHEWDVPGGEVWTKVDFDKFGSLGVGSGGFGAFFPIGFNYIFRFMPNGLETDQATFAKVVGGEPSPAGIQDLAKAICDEALRLGMKMELNTTARVLGFCNNQNGTTVIVEKTPAHGMPTKSEYDLVIVGTTTRVMSVGISLTNYQNQLLSKPVCAAVNDIHSESSTKVFIRTRKFWENKDPSFPRVVLSDTWVPQLYTLDYGHEEFGMVLVTYAWGDLSDQLMALTKEALLERLKSEIDTIMRSTDYPDYATYLDPVTPNDIYIIHWQLDENSRGAFTLALPGQDTKIADAFYDFEKLSRCGEMKGIVLNGESITFSGGWVEGALQAAMNTVSAVLKCYGQLAKKASDKAPVNLVSSGTYTY